MVEGLADSMWALLCALGLTALAWRLGCRLLDRCAGISAEGIERALLGIGVGFGLLSLLTFALGIAGLSTPLVIRVAWGALIAAVVLPGKARHRPVRPEQSGSDDAGRGSPGRIRPSPKARTAGGKPPEGGYASRTDAPSPGSALPGVAPPRLGGVPPSVLPDAINPSAICVSAQADTGPQATQRRNLFRRFRRGNLFRRLGPSVGGAAVALFCRNGRRRNCFRRLWERISFRRARNLPGSEVSPPTWAGAVAGVTGLTLAGMLALCLTPMVDYDGLAYHVAAPKRWLELGGLHFLPTQMHTQWPMGWEMLFLLLLPVGGAGACKPLVWIAAALTALTCGALGRRLNAPSAGIVAGALFVLWAGAAGINTTSVEVPLALFVALSALALAGWQQATEERGRRGWLVLAAVLAGFACCVKLNGLLCAGFLALAVGAVGRQERASLSARAAGSGLFLAFAVACAAPWFLRTWIQTGNPVYPFAYGVFGGRYWSAEAGRILTEYFRVFNLPGETLEARQAVQMRHLAKFGGLAAFAALLPQPRWTRGLIAAAGAFALIQVALSDQWRFLLPAAPFAGLVLGFWIARAAQRLPAAGWAAAGGLAFLMLPGALRDGWNALPVAVGTRSRAESLREVDVREPSLWANRNLPAGAKVLFGPDARTFFLERAAYWSNPITQRHIVYDTPEAFADSLRREGVTHLFLTRGLWQNQTLAFETRIGWRALERERLEALAARSQRLYANRDIEIYQLNGK